MSGGKIFRKFLIFLCLAALMLTGCTSAKTEEAAQQETDGKEENGEKKIQIGLTVDSFVIERWIRDRDVFVATARDLGAEVYRMQEPTPRSRSVRSITLSRNIWM